MNKRLRGLFSFTFMLPFSISALAWDGVSSGKVISLEVTETSNYGLRVTISPVGAMCPGGPTWAYLLEGDSNYRAYLAILIASRINENNVTVFSQSVNGKCHIGHIQM